MLAIPLLFAVWLSPKWMDWFKSDPVAENQATIEAVERSFTLGTPLAPPVLASATLYPTSQPLVAPPSLYITATPHFEPSQTNVYVPTHVNGQPALPVDFALLTTTAISLTREYYPTPTLTPTQVHWINGCCYVIWINNGWQLLATPEN